MRRRRIALFMAMALVIIISSVSALNFVLSDKNEPDPPTNGNNDVNPVYDYGGGVGLFSKGIHVIATTRNPSTFSDGFQSVNEYWQHLKENETVDATSHDFISIIISRGDQPTGGYTLHIESFSWLESYPVRFRFHLNFTDPGDGVPVTEALTNPLVLVPIDKLSPGEYIIEVHIVQYILTFDDTGKPVYTPIPTFKEEVWKLTFTIQ